MGRIDGKVALITGAASGIGLAAARLFVDEGATVVLTDRDEPAAETVLAGLGKSGKFHLLDVTREEHWIGVTDAVVAEFGRLDILVNSAGVALLRDIETTTLEEWRALMAVNLDGTFLGCKHAVRVMKQRGGGSIVNMSSVAGLIGSSNLAAYGASKGGVRLLTKSVALHCAQGLQYSLQFGPSVVRRNADAAGYDRRRPRPGQDAGQLRKCRAARPARPARRGRADDLVSGK
jgi:3(or 17)beta-hydroxysteroid dehydrogenase